ncbi:MAG: 16S rRNA (guanine(966)-N(2))-methyltransferase RsmD [Victivallales bacterium]|nr:16S rRNA (guanine(966)-N(2))-methyltransferase RsmD [Victivallales bacterium]
MRIISGMARGIRLKAPEGNLVRPTEDRVKESMFGTIGDLTGKRVLDLFSGSGALGLEALSRGAARVVMVEREPRHVQVMKSNLAAVAKAVGEGCGEAVILTGDAGKVALEENAFDVILADPPYHVSPGQYGAEALLADSRVASALADGGLLVLEHASDLEGLNWSEEAPWRLLRTREFGIRAISYAKKRSADA